MRFSAIAEPIWPRPIKPTSIALSLAQNHRAAASDQPPQRSAERDLALADIFAVAVVVELVDDAASARAAGSVALCGIDADIDDHGRAGADNDWFGRRRSGESAPAAPTQAADERLILTKTVEAEAFEAIGAEAVKAKSASLKPPVEAAGRKMGKMTAPKSQATRRPTHAGVRRREAKRENERGQGVGARSPHHKGNTHGKISGAARSSLTAPRRRCPCVFRPSSDH